MAYICKSGNIPNINMTILIKKTGFFTRTACQILKKRVILMEEIKLKGKYLQASAIVQNQQSVSRNFGNISDYNELGNYFQKEYNINIDNSIKKLNFEDVKNTLSGAESAFREFPECAHSVEQLMIDANSAYTYPFEKTIAWNKCTEAKSIVLEACKNIKKTPYGKGKKNAELISNILRYAADNASETMAEAFADIYANGENA